MESAPVASAVADVQCPIARAVNSIGEWWSILILREALYGLTRFDEFEKSLRIAPNMLTRRLKSLVESGVLERRIYSERPTRYEYVLTDAGRDFRSVIVALYAWSNRHLAPEGHSVVLVNTASGEMADPVLIDRRSGAPITTADFMFVPGPMAGERIVKRLTTARELRAKNAMRDPATEAGMAPATAVAAKTKPVKTKQTETKQTNTKKTETKKAAAAALNAK